ncbi:hypothetical protein BMI85_09770 [Thioclava sp. DLFJ4-1]|nr:hypothetical protein BMI85_09770 [Thioclava sp. DLFJ4-1]
MEKQSIVSLDKIRELLTLFSKMKSAIESSFRSKIFACRSRSAMSQKRRSRTLQRVRSITTRARKRPFAKQSSRAWGGIAKTDMAGQLLGRKHVMSFKATQSIAKERVAFLQFGQSSIGGSMR